MVGEVVVHPGDATGVVTGLGGGVGGVGGGQGAVGVAREQEVLDLGADPRLEAGVGRALDQRLQDDAGCVRPRLALDVGVAVHDRQPLLDEGDRGEGRRVRDRHQVGVLGLLAHGADGVSGESDALGGEQVDGLDGHQLRARLAAQVDEQREDEPGARILVRGPRVRCRPSFSRSLIRNQSITVGNSRALKDPG